MPSLMPNQQCQSIFGCFYFILLYFISFFCFTDSNTTHKTSTLELLTVRARLQPYLVVSALFNVVVFFMSKIQPISKYTYVSWWSFENFCECFYKWYSIPSAKCTEVIWCCCYKLCDFAASIFVCWCQEVHLVCRIYCLGNDQMFFDVWLSRIVKTVTNESSV